MSTFEREDHRWRETFFVVFDEERRPTAERMRAALSGLGHRYEVENLRGDDAGMFSSVTLRSPEDYSAIDISYAFGAEIVDEGRNLAEEIQSMDADDLEIEKIGRLRDCPARFDVLHFEKVEGDASEDEVGDMLDPSALLLVMETLALLTEGVGVDPQSGTVM
jgi:hypothetical protein